MTEYQKYLSSWLTYDDQSTYEKIQAKRLRKYEEAE
jgi:hypothetical protein